VYIFSYAFNSAYAAHISYSSSDQLFNPNQVFATGNGLTNSQRTQSNIPEKNINKESKVIRML